MLNVLVPNACVMQGSVSKNVGVTNEHLNNFVGQIASDIISKITAVRWG